jgi:S-adenosylmethionine hydrolase
VRTGARRLARAIKFTPPAIHLAVVDPGVGGPRRALAIRAGDRVFVGPDNGLLIEAAEPIAEVVDVTDSPHRLTPTSATFHGRDIFAPVAAHLALGEPLAGPRVDPATLVRLPDLGGIVRVVEIDGFGNVITNAALPATPRVRVNGHDAVVGRTFADAPPGGLVLYEDSAGEVALAVNGGSAQDLLGVTTGDALELA